jgi:hypothetical protein
MASLSNKLQAPSIVASTSRSDERRPFARLAPHNLDADATPVHGSGKKPLKTGLRLGRVRVLPRINPCPRPKK